jgi:DNA-nicking Smr family endonuclease
MSDLLPLVAAVLGDQAAVDALEEIQQLQQALKLARAVEILHCAPPRREEQRETNNAQQQQQADNSHRSSNNSNQQEQVVVYASGQFQNGE